MPPSSRRPSSPPAARRPPSTVPWLWSAAVGALFGVVYAFLAPRVWGGKDAGEITLALAVGGAMHPTGYPLYTLAGHAFVVLLHRLGVAWPHAANLWSAAGAAVAMGLFHALAARMAPPGAAVGRLGRAVLALVATTLIGLHPAWLLDAMLAEVYSWHLAWVCGACLIAVALLRAMAWETPRGVAPWSGRRLAGAATVWGLACGLGLAHHATSVLVIAPLSLAIVAAAIRARLWRAWMPAVALAAALVPLAGYGFIAYRAYHPAPFQWPILRPSLGAVIAHVTGAEYRDLLGRFAPQAVQRDLFRAFIYPVLFPALAALLVAAWRARPRPEPLVVWSLFAAAALQTAYGFAYGVSDPSSYFQPNLALGLLGVPLLGAGLLRQRRVLPALGVLVVAGLVMLGTSWLRFAGGLRIGVVLIERQVHAAWRALPDEEAIVLWRHDMVPVLRGYQLLDGERPRLYVQDPNALTWEAPRRAFAARFGFDPLAGLLPLTASTPARIPGNINRRTDLPVFVFGEGAAGPMPKSP
jgi:hypothetical protein